MGKSWISVLVALAPTAAFAGPPIAPGIEWARQPDDELGVSPYERQLGVSREELAELGSHWEGDMLFTGDGLPASAFAALGRAPQHAMSYDPSPGILYVEMNGVTLSPTCGNGDNANAALNCSPLVDGETNFPAYGNGSAQAATYQELQTYYEPFNIVLTSQRPPDWLPYTMAVIGGASNQGGGVCGVANVACDGLKRNHVSLTFPESCGGVSETAAQETSHNWGLEHVDDSTDLMYPFNNGGFKTYVDACNAVNHDTGGGVTQCGYIHEVYCPAGGGEQQNSYAELMGVFGPRQQDTVTPEIVSISPADGSVFESSDSFTVTAMITDDSNFVGVKWTWLEGLPEDLASYTRCTNNVCDNEFDPGVGFDPSEFAWDFVSLSDSPPGTYSFQLEVMDTYGNYATETITIEIVPNGTSSATSPDTSGTDPTAEGSGTSDPTDPDTGGTEEDESDDAEGTSTLGATGDPGPEAKDCACDARRSPFEGAWLLVLAGLVRSRRRTAR